jgi:hypothetical protein
MEAQLPDFEPEYRELLSTMLNNILIPSLSLIKGDKEIIKEMW